MILALVRRILVTIALLATATSAVGVAAEKVDDDGFVRVFNGKDLEGFLTTGNWIVEPDGVIALQPQEQRFRLLPDIRTFLWLEDTYDDFVLDLEFKVQERTNSGVFVRCSSSRSYLEVQVCDSHGEEEPLTHADCGAVFGIAAPSKNMVKPAGEWNHARIRLDGDQMSVRLNGQEVVALDLSDSEKTREIQGGRIGFQNDNTPVSYRNLRIKRLN